MLRQFISLLHERAPLLREYLSNHPPIRSRATVIFEELQRIERAMQYHLHGAIQELVAEYRARTIEECKEAIIRHRAFLKTNHQGMEISRLHLYAAQLVVNPKLAVRVVIARGPYAAKVIKSFQKQCAEVYLVCAEWERNSYAAGLAGHQNVVYVDRLENLDEVMQAIRTIKQKHPLATLLVDPGYDFHAESPAASAACWELGVQFAGAPPNALAFFSSKMKSKILAKRCGIPTVPGFDIKPGPYQDMVKNIKKLGRYVMMKGDNGGGGTANYKIDTENPEALRDFLISKNLLSEDGKAVLASKKRFFVESCLEKFSHIEIQGGVDKRGTFTLMSRDCSVQRRNQKLLEFAPARHPLTALAQQAAEAMLPHVHAMGYLGLLTFEFMAARDENNNPVIYFLEINPRIQVEHTVTEMLYEIDLPELKARITAGELADDYFKEVLATKYGLAGTGLSTQQKLEWLRLFSPHRVAVEVRLNAYETKRNHQTQKVEIYGINRRANTVSGDPSIHFGIEDGSHVDSRNVNSNIALVCAGGKTYEEALQNAHDKLGTCKTDIPTNQGYLNFMLTHIKANPEFPLDNQSVDELDNLFYPAIKLDASNIKSLSMFAASSALETLEENDAEMGYRYGGRVNTHD